MTPRQACSHRATLGSWGVLLGLIALALLQSHVWAHAFISRSEPRSGATLGAPPSHVRLWFDGLIEPLFATIRVENSDKQRVDAGNSRVNPGNATLLEVELQPLPPGRYRVFWSVVARDGHRREGEFSFLLK